MVFPCSYGKIQTLYPGQQYLQPHPMSYSPVVITVQSLRSLFCFSNTQSPFCFLNSCSFAWNVRLLPLGIEESSTDWNSIGYWDLPCPMSPLSPKHGLCPADWEEYTGPTSPNWRQHWRVISHSPWGGLRPLLRLSQPNLPLCPILLPSFPSTGLGISTSESASQGIRTW